MARNRPSDGRSGHRHGVVEPSAGDVTSFEVARCREVGRDTPSAKRASHTRRAIANIGRTREPREASDQRSGSQPRNRGEKVLGNGFLSVPRLTAPPKITYGKKTTNLLSLTAKQFKGDIYAVHSDGEDDEPSEQFLMAGGLGEKGSTQDIDESGPSDAGDSEDEVAEILQSAATSGRSEAGHAHCGKGQEVQTLNFNARANLGHISDTRVHDKPGRVLGGREIKPAQRAPTKTHPTTPARRLPVNELFLVASRPDYTRIDPASSYQGVEAEDPIDYSSSSPRKHPISLVDSEEDANDRKAVKTPLTDIRKRIRTERWRYKRLATTPAKIHQAGLKPEGFDCIDLRGRDGFEPSELAVQNRPLLRRKPRAQTPLLRKFGALELGSGPLPDVEFESPIKHELQTQVKESKDALIYEANSDEHVNLPPNASRSSSRRVSFIDRAREDRIIAELCSISAPARAPSESEDSDFENEDAEPLQDQIQNQDQDADGSDQASDEDDEIANVKENETGHQENVGVTLDFRRPELLAQSSITRSFQRRNLMEVNESIVEVPETSSNRHCAARISERPAGQRPQRLPSILKNSTPRVPDSTSMPEHTYANTRHNSFVRVEESRYFAGAADALRDFDPTRHKIVPRRPSYLNFHEMQVPDSDLVVPQTSPDQSHYPDVPRLNALFRTSEAEWKSSICNTGAKDLKTLTRSVSREHGTLSQSVRRRPSVAFQTPRRVL